MDRRIYKYALDMTGTQTIPMPRGAQALHVGVQDGQIHLWADVDTERPKVATKITIAGTGHPLDHLRSEGRHAGTVFMGPFVWHVFIQET